MKNEDRRRIGRQKKKSKKVEIVGLVVYKWGERFIKRHKLQRYVRGEL